MTGIGRSGHLEDCNDLRPCCNLRKDESSHTDVLEVGRLRKLPVNAFGLGGDRSLADVCAKHEEVLDGECELLTDNKVATALGMHVSRTEETVKILRT
jgi:hypothetical protein